MADGTEPDNSARHELLPAEIERWVADHHQAVFRYAYRLSGSTADAEDLTQQTFLIAQLKGQQVRLVESVRGWLLTVVRNCYWKRCRERAPAPMSSLGVDVNQLPEDVADRAIDGEQLQAALDELSDEFRVVVLMFYFEERAYREIAEALGIPLGTVMSRLARAKAHLRRALSMPAELVSLPLAGGATANPLSAMSPQWTTRR